SVNTAIQLFYGPLHNRLYGEQGQMDFFGNMVLALELQEASVTFAQDNDHMQAMLTALIELFDMALYPELD
ncbi:MAG: hypothetical protein EA374_03830, partial [Acholeplasmatales bacterium]